METDRTPGELKMKFRASSDDDSFEFQIHNNGNNTVVSADEEKLTLQVSQISENGYSILCDGESFRVTVENESDEYRVAVNQYTYNITLTDGTKIILEEVGGGRANHTGELHAPIPGLVSSILVSQGESVSSGQRLIIIDAMKMENEITSPISGIVNVISVEVGSSVNKNELLLTIERNQ
jgi:biotin carboxyl carrier protein